MATSLFTMTLWSVHHFWGLRVKVYWNTSFHQPKYGNSMGHTGLWFQSHHPFPSWCWSRIYENAGQQSWLLHGKCLQCRLQGRSMPQYCSHFFILHPLSPFLAGFRWREISEHLRFPLGFGSNFYPIGFLVYWVIAFRNGHNAVVKT